MIAVLTSNIFWEILNSWCPFTRWGGVQVFFDIDDLEFNRFPIRYGLKFP